MIKEPHQQNNTTVGKRPRAILLVEDNPDDEELTLMALKESHLLNPIVVAHDGVEAIDYLFGQGAYSAQGAPPLPAVILLDLKLPRLSGLEVLERLRAHPRTALVPVVVLTSSSEEEDILNSYRRGANSFVRKPVVFDRFADAVRQLGLYWLLLNELPPE
jgi:CheY-like chemotaxis protein